MEEKKTGPKNPRAKKYKAKNWKQFNVEMHINDFTEMTEHIEKHRADGYTRNGFVRAAIKEKIYYDEHPDEPRN